MTFPLTRPARLAVFASGRGSNLASLVAAFPPGDPFAAVELVISNRRAAGALEVAQSHGIPAHAVPFGRAGSERQGSTRQDFERQGSTRQGSKRQGSEREGSKREAFEQGAERLLTEFDIDLICLAGFMRLFSPAFTARYAGRMINIHPSLLPAFPGLHPQRQALAAGAAESGCTVHFVDAGVDTGAPIMQRRVPVYQDDTEELLAARILREEHQAYPEAVRQVLLGQLEVSS